jgi:hypothetical protein
MWLFTASLLKHWWALMSCAAFTILGVYVAASNKGNAWIVGGTTVLAAACFVVAAYQTWRDQYDLYAAEVVKNQQAEIHSPTVAATHVGTINIGAQPLQQVAVTRNRREPKIVCRGTVSSTCELPYYDDSQREMISAPAPCTTIAFRNDATTTHDEADNVVAHLDFYSDTGERTSVNEGWWCENSDEGGIHTFYIAKAETKHLVIVAINEREQQCYSLNKRWIHNFGRHLPEPVTLKKGHWRLQIELTAEGFRSSYYLDGEIFSNGSSRWSSPSDSQPSGWTVENE